MENLTNWCVYMHENRVSGKKYIGITSQKPTRRWANGNGYSRCPFFYAAIQKYGWDAFRHEILFTDLTQEDAEALEILLIRKYRTNDRTKGYNLATGGEVNRGFHRTEDFKKRLSETRKKYYTGERHNMYGKPRTAETVKKIRAAQAGRPKPAEACTHMREAAKRRWREDNITERERLRQLNKGGNSARARAVRCIDTGEIYPAMREAAEQKGVELSSLIRCCKGQRRTAGGLRWEYVEGVVSDD